MINYFIKHILFNTFYESLLEIKYSASSKLENFKEENEKSRSLETKTQF